MTKTVKTSDKYYVLKITKSNNWYKCHCLKNGKEVGVSIFYSSFIEAKKWGLAYVWIHSIYDKAFSN